MLLVRPTNINVDMKRRWVREDALLEGASGLCMPVLLLFFDLDEGLTADRHDEFL